MRGFLTDGRRTISRIGAALAVFVALLVTPRVVNWLEAAYPPNDGLAGGVLLYALATLLACLLVVVTSIAWIWPSWVIASWMRPDDTREARALRAIVLTFFLRPAVHAAIIGIAGRDVAPDRYRLVVLATEAAMLLAAALATPPRAKDTPFEWQHRFVALAGAATVATLMLLGRIAWADLNPDGTELLTMGQSLAAFVVPRLPTGEVPGVNLGMITVAYPINWLLAIGGLSPVAARLPAIGYIALVGLGVTAIAEHEARTRLSTTEFALLLTGVVAVMLTIGFNASYDPYSTDLASPASIDMLALVFLVATLYFLFAGEMWWCLAAAVLQALSRPSAPLLSLMLVAAIVIVDRDVRSRRLQLALIATAATLVVSLIYVFAIEAMTGSEVSEGGGNLLLRIRFLRFDDWKRLAYFIVPAGIVPVMLMTRWRQFDGRGAVMALVALAYFAFFYGLAFIALHHFAPAMLLPLAVFWRTQAQRDTSTGVPLRVGLAAGLAIAVVAALPRSMAPFRDSREIGSSIAMDLGDVHGYALIRKRFDASRVLDSLFAPYWRVADAQGERVSDPGSLAWYATKGRPDPSSARYVVQPEGRAAPEGATPLGTARGFALYTRDVATWQRQRQSPPPPDVRSRLYDVSRTTLFQHLGRDEGVVQVDLRDVACRVLPSMQACASPPPAPGTGRT